MHRSQISQSLPYLGGLENLNNTQSDNFLPHLILANQRETPSFLRPGESANDDVNEKHFIDMDGSQDIKFNKQKTPTKKMKLPYIG